MMNSSSTNSSESNVQFQPLFLGESFATHKDIVLKETPPSYTWMTTTRIDLKEGAFSIGEYMQSVVAGEKHCASVQTKTLPANAYHAGSMEFRPVQCFM